MVLAGLHDFLQGLAPVDFAIATATADRSRLSAFQANHVAAMVELAASARGVAPPAWAAEVAPANARHHKLTRQSGLRGGLRNGIEELLVLWSRDPAHDACRCDAGPGRSGFPSGRFPDILCPEGE